MTTAAFRNPALPSLDRLRADLQPTATPRRGMWPVVLAAALAAVAGVSAAAVMILGPTGAMPAMSHAAFIQSEDR